MTDTQTAPIEIPASPPHPAVAIVIGVYQADVDNLARYMLERELGDEDSDEVPFSVFQSAAADAFERAVDSIADDPEYFVRHFRSEWDRAFDKAVGK